MKETNKEIAQAKIVLIVSGYIAISILSFVVMLAFKLLAVLNVYEGFVWSWWVVFSPVLMYLILGLGLVFYLVWYFWQSIDIESSK